MKKIVLSLSIISLVLNCSSDRSSDDFVATTTTTTQPVREETPKTEAPKEEEPAKEEAPKEEEPAKEEAKVSITATGRTSYQNIVILVGYRSGNVFVEETRQALSNNGKATIDLSKYVNKTMHLKAVEINGNTMKDVSDVRQITLTPNKTQNITLAIKPVEVQKVYNANITVNKNGKPLANTKVYALTRLQAVSVKLTIPMTGSEALKNMPSATTNSSGVAKFTNLENSDAINGQYEFVVITQEPTTTPPLIQGKYESVSLTLDGINVGAGTINFNQTKVLINFNAGTGTYTGLIKLLGNGEPRAYTILNGKLELYDLPAGNYTIENAVSGRCEAFSPNAITVREKADNVYNISVNKIDTGKLTLNNNSTNPYTVTITYADNKKEEFVMSGKTTKSVDAKIGSTKVAYKQNSGYLIYPTTGDKTAQIKCGETATISFP